MTRPRKQNAGKPLPRRPGPRDLIRMLRRVRVDPHTGCWVWTGHTDRHGYGQVKLWGRAHWVHRVFAQAFRGQFAAGEEADHGRECLNASCCNPDHVRAASKSANASDGARRRWERERTECENVAF